MAFLPSPPTPVQCTGKDHQVRTFYYDYERDPSAAEESWFIRVHAKSPSQDADHWFSISLREYTPDTLMVSMQEKHNNELYGAKGILDAMIPELSRVLNRRICSSSNEQPKYDNESRNNVGATVWERLEKDGLAGYDKASDRYFLR